MITNINYNSLIICARYSHEITEFVSALNDENNNLIRKHPSEALLLFVTKKIPPDTDPIDFEDDTGRSTLFSDFSSIDLRALTWLAVPFAEIDLVEPHHNFAVFLNISIPSNDGEEIQTISVSAELLKRFPDILCHWHSINDVTWIGTRPNAALVSHVERQFWYDLWMPFKVRNLADILDDECTNGAEPLREMSGPGDRGKLPRSVH